MNVLALGAKGARRLKVCTSKAEPRRPRLVKVAGVGLEIRYSAEQASPGRI
jgi:hypothetical protein